jgi:hypothetical protein
MHDELSPRLRGAAVKTSGGSWRNWLAENCSLSAHTARLYMQVAKNGNAVADFEFSQGGQGLGYTEGATLIESGTSLATARVRPMRLFHYTHPSRCLLIAMHGLSPQCREENALMTGGLPVVWLTKERSNVVSPEHVQQLAVLGVVAKVGEPMYGGSARLEVHLDRSDKLLRYADFVQKTKCISPAKLFRTALTASWWVHLDVIPPHKIEPIDAATYLECLDHHIETHPDLEARARFKAQREKIRNLPPDARITLTVA